MDEQLRTALAQIVGEDHLGEPTGHLERGLDGVRPRLLVSPGAASEVAEVLALATRAGQAVLVVGKGHALGLGNIPARGDLWLSTSRLEAVEEYEPADLTISVEGGCTLGEINRRLAQHGQILPLDPPGGGERTIGGIASVGRAGPLQMGFGKPRDMVIGIQVATPEGKLIRAGGKVVKNAAGYDLCKLFVGSLGSLGVITALNLRVRPKPATEMTVGITAGYAPALWSLVRALPDHFVQPVCAEILSPEIAQQMGFQREAALFVRVAGEEADVRQQVLALEALVAERALGMAEQIGGGQTQRFWDGVANLPLAEQAGLALRISMAPARLEETTAEALDLLVGCGTVTWNAGPAIGILRVLLAEAKDADADLPAARIRALRERCVVRGGSLVVERAPLEVKEELDVWGSPGSGERIMRGMKELFDPQGLMNPGRFVSRL